MTKSIEEMQASIAAAKSKIPVGVIPKPLIPRFDQVSATEKERILTPEQQKILMDQGKFIGGVGAAYAANQPGENNFPEVEEAKPIDPKLAPRPPGAGLRQNTIEDLEAIADANKNRNESKDLDQINQEINEMDDGSFQTNEFGERIRNPLSSKARRKAIEDRCAPLKFEELLQTGSVKQKVPIIPGVFEPVFRSLQGDEDVEILRMIGTLRGADQYILDTLSIYKLTASLYSLNGKILPNHLNKEGDLNEQMFKDKYKVVVKNSSILLNDLIINLEWFNQRVQKLMVVDNVKGF